MTFVQIRFFVQSRKKETKLSGGGRMIYAESKTLPSLVGDPFRPMKKVNITVVHLPCRPENTLVSKRKVRGDAVGGLTHCLHMMPFSEYYCYYLTNVESEKENRRKGGKNVCPSFLSFFSDYKDSFFSLL